MSLSIKHTTAAVLFLFVVFLFRPATAEGQTVIHPYGQFCTGSQNVFVYQGPGTVNSWSISGSYTIISQNSNSIVIQWNSPVSGGFAQANYSGGSAYYSNINVTNMVTPSVTISSNLNNVCSGTAVTFTASPVNGGAGPSYQWYVNGSAVSGATSSTWTTTSLTNGQQVNCYLNSSLSCVSTNSVASNTITMTINSPTAMTATINGSTSLCGTTTAGFSVSVQNAGPNLTYQWRRNGGNISSNQGTPPPYALAYGPVNNGDVFTCVVSSSSVCYPAVTSNAITVSLTSPQPFTVSVGPSGGINYCVGQTVTFNAYGSQSISSYQWQQNGGNIAGQTGSTYTTTVTSLAQLQGIGCYATTSGGACIANTTATGTAANIPFTVNPSVTPSVSIASSAGTNICSGSSVTFTATPANGGSSPSYQWKINGTAVSGATGNTFASSSLTNGQQVSCTLTSSAVCATTNTVTSNAVTMNVTPITQMTLNINGSTSICQNNPAGFSANVSNSGGNLTYQWMKNGGNISSDGPGAGNIPPYALSYQEVNNGDVFSCKVSSDNACYLQATSNSETVTINQPQAFTVGVGPSGGINYCVGQSITFTANGSQPITSYQWQQNGSNITGQTGSTYTTTVTSLAQLQGIGVYATTSGGSCIANTTATGTATNIPFTVNSVVTPSVSIASSAGISICSGSTPTFTATPVNGGFSPLYQWQINGVPVSGATGSTFTPGSLTNGQQVSCVLTSDAACVTTNTATSNTLTMSVTPITQMTLTISGSTTICQNSPAGFGANVQNSGGNLTYQWMKNSGNISSDGPGAGNIPAYALSYQEVNTGDVFSCKVSSDNACYLPATSNSETVTIVQPQTFTVGIGVQNINFCQGAPVIFTAHGSLPLVSYQWEVNGAYVPGATGPTYQTTATSVADLQSVSLLATNSGGFCIANSSNTGTTSMIPFSITPTVPTSVSFSSDPATLITGLPVTFTANPVNPGDLPHYQWQINGVDVQGATGSTFTKTFSTGSEFQNISLTMNSSVYCAINPATSAGQYQIHLPGWENQNYIRVHEVLIPGVTDWRGVGNLAIGDKTQTTVYFDGLERPIENVKREMATPDPTVPGAAWGDIVSPSAYDNLGRAPQGFLPYTTTTEPGLFKSSPLTEQPQYYSTNYNESPAYSQTTYESSPLNRVINIKAPGSVWNASVGNSTSYDLNDQTADNVQIWGTGDNPGDNPSNLGSYPSNTLFKTSHTDDKGNLVVEFTNNSGQLVLKKVEISQNHPTPHGGWICTYNVYDDQGLLRFIIQPEAVKYLEANSWSFAGTSGQQVLDQLCFRYEYDERGRLTGKKAPGAKESYIVYDKRDRTVFTQDANQRGKSPGEWTAILYDELDRPVVTALYETGSTPQDLQNQLAAAGSTSQLSIPAQGVTVTAYNSPLTSADLSNASVTTILKYEFYDDYSYAGAKPFSTSFDNGLAYPNGEPMTPTQRTLSLSTGKLVRVLGTSTFLETTLYYDEKGRRLQLEEDNYKGGMDITTSQYQFDGRLLSANTKHSTANTGYTNYSVISKYLFDKIGRVTGLQKKYGSNDFKTIASYDFDDMGRMKTKHLDPGYTGAGKTELESVTYSYNINNQLTGINKDYALKTPGKYDKWGNYFGLYLGYDNKDGVFTDNQLNGHITGSLWSTQGDDVQRKYDYSYDEAGRLINGQYNEKQNPGDTWSHATMDFSITGANGQIEYDLNGNLTYLLHKGVVQGNNTVLNVDDLHYQYNALSNTLISVTDNSTAGNSNGLLGDFKDGTNGSSNDYVYDDNGNLVIDLNKNITSIGGNDGINGIHYNYLDKPEVIHIPGKGTINIVYDAEGNKLQRSYTPEGGPATTTLTYAGAFVYQGDNLQYINFEEGRIRVMQTISQNNGYDLLSIDGNMDLPGNNRGAYDFFLHDHLGNVRMILTEETHLGSNSCTMEAGRAANEEPVFGKVDANGIPTTDNEVKARFSVNSIPGQTSGNGWTDPTIGAYVSRVGNLAASRIGPNTLMKVMAGDKITAQTIYYYQNQVVNTTGGASVITDLLTSLASAISGSTATAGIVHSGAAASGITSQLNGNLPFSAAADPDAGNASGTNPKAYLTVLFFDERFNFVGEGSAAYRVQTSGNGASPLVLPPTRAPKNGYAYVYVSNESDEMVYFDNLQVSNAHGQILEENHYYSHGLRIAAISSRKLPAQNEGQTVNKYLFNEKELIDEADVNWYDYGYRNYDPQIGRFTQLDPLTDLYPEWTPYQYAGNEPIGNVDLDGLEPGGLPTPGGVWNGSFLQQASQLGSQASAAAGPLEFASAGLTQLSMMANAVSAASSEPAQGGLPLIAHSADNLLYNKQGGLAEDGTHQRGPADGDNEQDLEKKMIQLIKDQTKDNPKMQAVALKMTQQFFDNTGGEFSDPDLDDAVNDDINTKDFRNNLMVRFNTELAKVGGDLSKLTTFTIGNPAYNNWHNNTDGLGITIHGVSNVEVHLVKFQWTNQKKGSYYVKLKIDMFDNFGLDKEDISPGLWPGTWYKFSGGLKAWYKLQHVFDHVPLRTHIHSEAGGEMNWHTQYRRK